MKLRVFSLLSALLLAALLAGCGPSDAGSAAGLSIHFIDVGQANASLLLCGGQAMLIDGGSAERGSQVSGYLRQLGISYLDFVVCTSADEAHMGGLAAPLYTCAVGRVLSPAPQTDDPVFEHFRRYTEAQGLSPAVPEPGESFSLGDATVTVLEPEDDSGILSLQVEHGGVSLRFSGDLEATLADALPESEDGGAAGNLVAESDGASLRLIPPET